MFPISMMNELCVHNIMADLLMLACLVNPIAHACCSVITRVIKLLNEKGLPPSAF